MSGLRRRLAMLLVTAFFFGWITGPGWVTYPGWVNKYNNTWPEQYAYPASTVSPCEPRWGFWFW
jgi:hypothetical protein